MFEKIVEMAIHSGLDKIGVDEEAGVKEDPENEDDDEKRSRHCRVTDFKKPTYSSRSASFDIFVIRFHQYGTNRNHHRSGLRTDQQILLQVLYPDLARKTWIGKILSQLVPLRRSHIPVPNLGGLRRSLARTSRRKSDSETWKASSPSRAS